MKKRTPEPIPQTLPFIGPQGNIEDVPQEYWAQALDSSDYQQVTEQEATKIHSSQKSVPTMIKDQFKEVGSAIGDAAGGKMAQLNSQSNFQNFIQPAKDLGGLIKGGVKRLEGVGDSIGKTIAAVPAVAKTAYGVTKQLAQGGKLSDPYEGNVKAAARLADTANSQKQAIRGIAEMIPTGMPQLAAGMSRGMDTGVDKNLSSKESLTRGILGGGASALTAKLGVSTAKNAYKNVKDSFNGTKKIDKISEVLQPQANAKEIKLAMADNRFTSGKDSKLFGKKQGVVAPSKDVVAAARTVYKEVPNAHKLTPEKLKIETENRVKTISQELKPELAKVQLTDATKEKMMNDFLKIKEDLTSNVNFMQSGGPQILKTFEDKFLMKALDNKNLDELWDDAIKLDKNKTIAPERARNATELSPANYLEQQDAWHELRKIFRNTIKNAEGGIGSSTTKKKFRNLRDLIVAKNNLISKAPSEFKKQGGILSKKNLFNLGLTAAGAGGINSIFND